MKFRKKATFMLTSVLLATSLAVTGCGGGGGADKAAGGSKEAATKPAAEQQGGGTLIFARASDSSHLIHRT
nr:hypothetical protein [Aneurinibacillus tyrosinisolvens]